MAYQKNLGYQVDTAFIAAHYQPAILIDLALSRNINSQQLLRGTRLGLEELQSAETVISPDQYLTLIANSQKLIASNDTSFLYGQRLLPGAFGACSQVMQQVKNLRQAIEIICEFSTILSPMQTPRSYEDDECLVIYWQEVCASKQQQFIIEATMTAIISMVSWLSKLKMPWQCEFNYSQPDYIEQYWVNIGQNITFDQQMNRMRLPKEWLDMTWPNAATLCLHGTLKDARKQLQQYGSEQSFLEQFYDYIYSNIDKPLNLDKASLAFGLSPASLKRKLKKHNTSFQQQVDLVRKNTAIYLHEVKHLSNQQIAEYLCFNDMNNFRRAFKRWTGTSPHLLFAS